MSPWIWLIAGIIIGVALTILAIFGFLSLLVYWKHEDDPEWDDFPY